MAVLAIFRIRRDTAANWTAENPVLMLGEPGLETDTRKVKYGDGATAWNALAYAAAGIAWGDITGSLAAQTDLSTALGAKAPLASPTFTGVPAAPTAAGGTNTTQLATTAFVTSALTAKAPIASPTFTGAVTFGGSTTITSGGRLVTRGSSASYHTLEENNADDYAAHVKNTSATNGFGLLINTASASGTGFNFLDCYAGGGFSSLTCRIRGNGDLQNINNSYGATSDRKLKTDIVDAGSQWADIKAVRLRKYRLRADPDGPKQLGVVAQEIEKVSPGLVDTMRDDRFVGGKRRKARTSTKAVKYSVLHLKALGALQEAMARIEALEQRLGELERKG